MRKFLLYSLFSFVFYTSLKAQINVLWEARYTSPGANVDAANDLVIDATGNIYVTGTSYSSITGYDIVTIKYDPLGNQQWIATYNGSGNGLDESRDIEIDNNGNIYVTGYTFASGSNYNLITIKYDNNGVQQWANIYNGTTNGFDEAYALAVDTAGNCYVTGSVDAGSQGSNFITIKYDPLGNTIWTQTYNGPGNSVDASTQIILDSLGNVYISGHSYGSGTDLDYATIKYNSSGAQQWVSRYNNSTINSFEIPEAITLDNNGNVYVGGSSYGGLATDNDYLLVKYDNNGNQQWARYFDGDANEEDKIYDIVADNNQNIYVTGRSLGVNATGENIITLKYDAAGNLIWRNDYNGPANGYDEGRAIALGVSGSLYITGYSAGIGTSNDYLTIKIDTLSGNNLWVARFDGPSSNSDQAFAMQVDNMESIYVTGTSKGAGTNQDFSTIKWCQLEVVSSTNTVAICLGDTITLQANANGATSYSWTPSTNVISQSGNTLTANPVSDINYIVSATNTLGCTDYDTIQVKVNPLPNVSISNLTDTIVCLGDSVRLQASNGVSYFWNTGDTTQNIVLYNSTNATVTVTDTNGCSNSDNIQVVVNPLPNVNAGSDTSVCEGYSVQLNATGASSYLWNTQSTLSDSTIANPFAFPTTNTTYIVTGTDINGCTNSDTINVAVNITPTADFVQSDDTVYLNQLPNVGFIFIGSNATSYFWDFGDGFTTVTQNPSHSFNVAGVYTVMLVAYNGNCTDTAYSTVTVLNNNSIADISDFDLKIFPNPAENELNLTTSSPFVLNKKMTILDINGREVKVFNELKNSTKMDISELQKGVYFVRIVTKKGTINYKFIKL
jgi:YD repeat-containing protein